MRRVRGSSSLLNAMQFRKKRGTATVRPSYVSQKIYEDTGRHSSLSQDAKIGRQQGSLRKDSACRTVARTNHAASRRKAKERGWGNKTCGVPQKHSFWCFRGNERTRRGGRKPDCKRKMHCRHTKTRADAGNVKHVPSEEGGLSSMQRQLCMQDAKRGIG